MLAWPPVTRLADHEARRPIGLQPPTSAAAGPSICVADLTSVVLTLPGVVVERRRDQHLDHVLQSRSPIGDELRRGAIHPQRCREEFS